MRTVATAYMVSLALHYGLRLDSAPEFIQGYVDGMRLDQRGQGVACGAGWISRSKKCSPDKARLTSKEAKAKTVEKAKARAELKRAVKEGKGQKARVKTKASTPETYFIPTAPTKDMKLVGKGAFGAVYLDEKNNVALKYVTFRDPAVAQFYSGANELRMMQKASDAGIGPKFFGTSQDADGNPIIAMEYLKGFDPLYDGLNKLSEKKQARVLADAVKAIKQMADARIIHNDTHPGNFMVNPDTGEVKVIDMGMAEDGKDNGATDYKRFTSSLAFSGSKWKTSPAIKDPLYDYPMMSMDALIKHYEGIANG